MANAILEALRGTRETIRYIGQDQAASKRRVAESKLMNAQLGYKQAAIESDLEFKKKDQQLKIDKFNILKKANEPMALGDYLDLVIPDLAINGKIKESIGEERLGKEYNANVLSQAGNAIMKQFAPKATVEGEFAKGTVVETDPDTGKRKVLQSPGKTPSTSTTLTPKELISSGLEVGTVAQKDESGKISVIQKPGDKKQTPTEKLEGQKELAKYKSDLKKTDPEKAATTAMGQFLKNNKKATTEQILDFTKKMESAKSSGDGGAVKKDKALKRISDISKAIATLEKTDTITQLLAKDNPELAQYIGQKLDPKKKAALMEAWNNELDHLEKFSGTTRKKKEVIPTGGGGEATHTFIPGQGIVPNK